MHLWAYSVSQTGRNRAIRHKEHQSHLRLGHTDKSALTEHGWITGQTIQFDQTKPQYKSDLCVPRTVRESLELLLSDKALNWKEGAKLSD